MVCSEMKEPVSVLPRSCTEQRNKQADVNKQNIVTKIRDVVKRLIKHNHDLEAERRYRSHHCQEILNRETKKMHD